MEPLTGHLNWMKNPYIDDLTTPAFGRWWFFHTIAVLDLWAVNRNLNKIVVPNPR